jgi:hypothetical protein
MDENSKLCYVCQKPTTYRQYGSGLYWCKTCSHFANNLEKNYNLTLDEYYTLLKAQDYRCAICGIHANDSKLPGPGKRNGLVVDHCHATNTVRGLLCHSCNNVLGSAKDSVSILTKSVAYLERKLPENPMNVYNSMRILDLIGM